MSSRYWVTLTLLFLVSTALGQIPCKLINTTNEQGDSVTYSIVEKSPYLINGLQPFMEWITQNMDKKLKTKKNQEKKVVYVGFVVEVNGTTSSFKIVKGLGEPYDNEAVRLIKENPSLWTPGQCGNKNVKSVMTMPIKF